MSLNTANIVADVVRSIIKQGKGVLKDHLVERQKASYNCNEMVIHGGYQAQLRKKHSHFSLQKDSMPQNIVKDNLAIKSHQIINHSKSVAKAQPTFKTSQQKYNSSKKYHRKSLSVSGHQIHLDDPSKQKQNQLIKLDENHGNRIVVQRVRQRVEKEQDKMRQKKRQRMLKQYEQKLQNQLFRKQRQDRQAQKQRVLESHIKKGEYFKFNFDHTGELMLFQSSSNLKNNYPPQTSFKIYQNFNEQDYQSTNQVKNQLKKGQIYPLQRNINQNQRIKSARGQAFSSSVMKTVNLSRISMNASLAQVDAQQFMKRNDLFNNNHSRQTTSIPYLQPKTGTVYTEIATKQVVTFSKEPNSSTTALAKDDISSVYQRDPSKKGKVFDGFQSNLDRKYAKTARIIGKKDEDDEDIIKTSSRPIKTAKQSARNSAYSIKRPQSSMNKGRITTANEKLVQSLLQQ